MTICLWSAAICDQDSTPKTNRFHLQNNQSQGNLTKVFFHFL